MNFDDICIEKNTHFISEVCETLCAGCVPGDKTVQCGRKVDALKLWVMWRAIGDAGMAAITDNCFRNARGGGKD
ncbi:CSAD-like protein [Mya arenaria]|uniref:CSAD-like protein n=1 Tax=Mya arenaria TaxID=6604 RepID=A0ABY7E917_MYAAR|nr:CSAD-like protein [Mya arenaria]